MRCVDVNVLVYAHRPESPGHASVKAWLEAARTGREALGIPSLVGSGFLRVVTNRKVFADPTPVDVAIDFMEGLWSAPAVVAMQPGERHWDIFTELCREAQATGNLVPDAYLAAMAIEERATFVTADRGFRRFPGLRLEQPGASAEPKA